MSNVSQWEISSSKHFPSYTDEFIFYVDFSYISPIKTNFPI